MSHVNDVGDEVLMLKRNLDCPIAVSEDRREAAKYLYEKYKLDLIISDDGLQHYNLPRNYEIVVVDGVREFGNARCLPAGPLREPVSRLNTVDLVVSNGENSAYENQFITTCEHVISLYDASEQTLHSFAGKQVHKDNLPILMTEKDTIKCNDFAKQNMWYVPISVNINTNLDQKLTQITEEMK